MTVAANPAIKHCHAPVSFCSFVIWPIVIWPIEAAPIFFLQAKQEPKFCGPLTFFNFYLKNLFFNIFQMLSWNQCF
jgi:hypothetical protein